MNKFFTIQIKVEEKHLDGLKHVNNVVYVQWLQDAALTHWKTFVSKELDEQVLWVVKRHEIDYLHSALLNDELIVKTWTGDYSAATWNRHYEIIRKADEKVLATAKSIWVLLNRKTFKPKRIDDQILNVLQ